MTFGFVMLVHDNLNRAAQVVRHLAAQGCPVVIHIDARVPDPRADRFRAILRTFEHVRFAPRRRCEWGGWSIVQATENAVHLLLESFPEARHVCLISGSCMPLRPIGELRAFLDNHPDTDFIESVTTSDAPWARGGLEHERFTLHFPFSWKRHRRLFDWSVALQRRLGIRHKPPPGIVPHLGSQWWCLTRRTLRAIALDPLAGTYRRYFRSLWIPDESYFQTLVRRHAGRVEGRSLTLTKFDHQGQPHMFYDDHLDLLRRSDAFFVRKVWPQADRLYRTFLSESPATTGEDSARIDRLFENARERRIRGRHGLVMQSRFVRDPDDAVQTAQGYSVLQGHPEVFDGLAHWLARAVNAPVHGRLFHPGRIEFAGGLSHVQGGLSDSAALRDYDPCGFLRNLIWNTRGTRQFFQYAPEDDLDTWLFMARDPNAQISVVTGAWAIPLSRLDAPFKELRAAAARIQRREAMQLSILNAPWARARTRVTTLAEYLHNPVAPLFEIVEEAAPHAARSLGEAPVMGNLDQVAGFLQELRNSGMNPHLAGPVGQVPLRPATPGLNLAHG